MQVNKKILRHWRRIMRIAITLISWITWINVSAWLIVYTHNLNLIILVNTSLLMIGWFCINMFLVVWMGEK